MTVTGYLSLQGHCYGGDLVSITVSLIECHRQCDAHGDCRGYDYILTKQTCILKKIMCRSPTTTGIAGSVAFFKIENEGKFLNLCKL